MIVRKLWYVAALAVLAASPSAALEPAYGAEADFVSDYVWRGMVFSPGFVAEPSAYVSFNGITPALWANVQLEDEYNTLDELDFSISYNRSFAGLYVEAGYVYYYLPEIEVEGSGGGAAPETEKVDPDDTQDIFVILAYPVGSIASVYSDHYVTVAGNAGGYYFDAGLGLGRSCTDYLGLDAYVQAGVGSPKFNDYNLGQDKFALNVVEAGVSATFNFLGVMYVRPHASYSTLVDGDLRDAVGEDTADSFFGGAAFGIEG
jgi:hypothetical protein